MQEVFASEEEYQAYMIERNAQREAMLSTLPAKLAELSSAIADGATETADIADALADLSAVVSGIVEGV